VPHRSDVVSYAHFSGAICQSGGITPVCSSSARILGANDFDGDTAERYGYVNSALPDAELDAFVDVLARRIASFDRHPIAAV
jgi:hypothetical protein